MTGNISSLKPVSALADEETVEILQRVLALAEKGELRNVAIVGDLTAATTLGDAEGWGTSTFTSFAVDNTVNLVGNLEVMKSRVLASMHSEDV